MSQEINLIKNSINNKRKGYLKSSIENKISKDKENAEKNEMNLNKNKILNHENLKNKELNNEEKLSLLKVKNFNDLNINLDSLKKNTNESYNGKNYGVEDINKIIESFKRKSNEESNNLNKKKFQRQVSLNKKEVVNIFLIFII